MERVVKEIANASAASAPSERALRTASGARARRPTSPAPDDDLASHERTPRGPRHVVLLALPARAAVELQFPRDHVDALQDREGVSCEGHPAHARADLPFADEEAALGDGLESAADGVLHPADPALRQDSVLRPLETLILPLTTGGEERVRHPPPDPTAEVLRPSGLGADD